MNIDDYAYLLGQAITLLKQCRARLISYDDKEGIRLIEDQYQELNRAIVTLYLKDDSNG